jgi:hypothetical protein
VTYNYWAILQPFGVKDKGAVNKGGVHAARNSLNFYKSYIGIGVHKARREI